MLSAVTLRGIVTYLRRRQPIYVKKFRRPVIGGYLLSLSTELGEELVYILPREGVFLPVESTPELEESSGFVLNVKRMIEGALVEEVNQVDMERIVELRFRRRGSLRLLVELFGGGNVILTDRSSKIKALERTLEVKDRILKVGGDYVLPPTRGFKLDEVRDEILVRNPDESAVGALTRILALDKYTIAEALIRIGFDPTSPIGEVIGDLDGVFKEITRLIGVAEEMREGVHVLYEDESPRQVLLFKPSFAGDFKTFNTLEEAGDEVLRYLGRRGESGQERRREEITSLIDKLRNERAEVVKRIEELRRAADYLAARYHDVQRIIGDVRGGGGEGISSGDLVVTRVDRASRTITMLLPFSISVSIRYDEKSAFSAISRIYERVKRLERGVSSIDERIKALERELAEIPSGIAAAPLRRKRRREWFEKFRWFRSSSGVLVIGGRDAKTNEILVKRYAKPESVVLHPEGYKGPFVLPLADDVDDVTLRQAAVFTASYSSAWKAGHRAVDVFWVKAEQLTKKTRGGEYLTTGAFVVTGKKSFIRGVPLGLGVGLERVDDWLRVVVGPAEALSRYCVGVVKIEPGRRRGREVAEEIVEKLARRAGGELDERVLSDLTDELLNLMPPGGVDVARD